MKLAVVVQRYGAAINGGAELHARYLAERLASRHEVEVVTTCARDYVTWRNELPPGRDEVNGVPVLRFRVDRERDPREFGRRSAQVFGRRHSLAQELRWLESEGPASRALLRHLAGATYDFVFFFSFRYHHAYHGVRAVPGRAVLVPTAERDPAVGLALFGPVFRGVRATMFNSFEERAMIRAVAGGADLPGVVVGVGSELPESVSPERFRQKYGIRGPFVIYVGRIDENKGCKELFAYFERHAESRRDGLSLVLVGQSILAVPGHPRVRHLGFLPDQDKFDAMAAAGALVMPSYFESLSMVTLEAWGLGRPVLVNGRCDVLRGQCIRSHAGLYYESPEEFGEALWALTDNPVLNAALGRNGREHYRRHYAWPVILRKYEETLARLQQEDREGRPGPVLEPLPGWWARRRRDVPPAEEVLNGVPAGPVVPRRGGGARERRSER